MYLVLEKGLEPLRLAAPDPKSGVSANSTTQAYSVTPYKMGLPKSATYFLCTLIRHTGLKQLDVTYRTCFFQLQLNGERRKKRTSKSDS